MNTKVEISRKLLAEIDFLNTINGGVSETRVKKWASPDSYKIVVKAPGVNPDGLRVDVADKYCRVYHCIDVLEGDEKLYHILATLPLTPDVDTSRISAQCKEDGRIIIIAPFFDWKIEN